MKKIARDALEKCIAKYEDMLRGVPTLLGPQGCELCKLFWQPDCGGCPVQIRTGEEDCGDTPYSAISAYLTPDESSLGTVIVTPDRKDLIKAVTAELEFLKSLRPKEKTPK